MTPFRENDIAINMYVCVHNDRSNEVTFKIVLMMFLGGKISRIYYFLVHCLKCLQELR